MPGSAQVVPCQTASRVEETLSFKTFSSLLTCYRAIALVPRPPPPFPTPQTEVGAKVKSYAPSVPSMSLPSVTMPSPFSSSTNYKFTLKSAPSRSAEVLNILSTKSGFLMKRNESNKWNRRFFCVVPHTFLYYFEDDKSSAPTGIIDLGESLGALRTRNFFPFPLPLPTKNMTIFLTPLRPECYTAITRTPGHIMELRGEDRANKDLRKFYFQAQDEEEGGEEQRREEKRTQCSGHPPSRRAVKRSYSRTPPLRLA